jgi:DNA polymerase (family X)
MDNYDIAEQFSLLGKLIDIHGDDPFKSKNYANIAFQLERVEKPITEMTLNEISAIKGVGKSSAQKLMACVQHGSLAALDEYLAKTPEGILTLLRIKGIGPKKINTIWKQLEVETPGELLYACNENRLTMYKGFGAKTQQNIKEALVFYFKNMGQYLYAEGVDAFESITKQFATYNLTSLKEVGAFTQQENVFKTFNWVLSEQDWASPKLQDIVHATTNNNDGDAVWDTPEGANHIFHITKTPVKTAFEKTCSEAFLTAFKNTFGDIPNVDNEEELFERNNIPFIPAYQRYFAQALNIYISNAHNSIIQPAQIKGMIHNHSTWSDGVHTLEKMAKACIEKGYEYLVISDHSRAAAYAGGLQPDRIKAQQEEINALNASYTNFKIFKSIECDILVDGRLDYDDAILSSFDLVIASVHSSLRMTEEKAMERLLKAIENPFTTILGHPTGRLLLSRKGYPLAYEKLFEACAKHNVVVELNAHPRRLDIDWQYIPLALQYGLQISIDPDAHSIEGFDDVLFGTIAARKGLLPTAKNISSLSLIEFEQWLSTCKP